MNKITALTAFEDNYIWALHSLDGKSVVVVDPGTAKPVLDYLHNKKMHLAAILITHHHADHCAGVPELCKAYPHIPVYGPYPKAIAGVTQGVRDNETIDLGSEFNMHFQVLAIPGHTLDHIAYYHNEILFCGDTLFSMGCGRLFEGTPHQMFTSLEKIKKLSDKTAIYCGHEYTVNNIKFAQRVSPDNTALADYSHQVQAMRHHHQPSLPSLLSTERKLNPFLRCDDPQIIQSVEQYSGAKMHDPVMVFAQLRAWKNTFKA